MKITPYVIALVFLDIFLCRVDGFWATDSAYKQFFVYDVATFGRIGLLASFSGLLMAFNCKIHIRKIDLLLWGLYWIYALYEFKRWLDFQSSYNG